MRPILYCIQVLRAYSNENHSLVNVYREVEFHSYFQILGQDVNQSEWLQVDTSDQGYGHVNNDEIFKEVTSPPTQVPLSSETHQLTPSSISHGLSLCSAKYNVSEQILVHCDSPLHLFVDSYVQMEVHECYSTFVRISLQISMPVMKQWGHIQ